MTMKYYENNFVKLWTQGSYLQEYQEQDVVPDAYQHYL